MELLVGHPIRLRAYGSELIERIVVGYSASHVFVCKSEEFEEARAEERQPDTVGFHISDIIHIVEMKN